MKIESVLEEFRSYLLLNFDNVASILNDDQLEDWLQANWEIIVEYRLQSFGVTKGLIDIYANGADCNANSSRVSLPDRQSVNSVHIAPDCVFHSFGRLVDGFFIQEPPFDYVKGESPTSDDLILPLSQVKFTIGKTYDELAT